MCPSTHEPLLWTRRIGRIFIIVDVTWIRLLVSSALLVCPWSSSRASRSKLALISLTIRFLPFTKHHGDSVAVVNAVVLVPGSLPLTRAFFQHSPSSPFFLPLPSSSMKLVFEIKTEPVTQASIIIAVLVAFSSDALALIAAYSESPSVCVACAIILAVIVYLALRLAPRLTMSVASDAPDNERTARRLPVGKGVPLVLQVSPLGSSPSPGQDKFFYDPFADLESGDFAAARAFFIHHGHVVFHDCLDAIAFQNLSLKL